jgi:hypothetical protein
MKLYWIVFVFAASITAQKSSLLTGCSGNSWYHAVTSLIFQNPSNPSGSSSAAQTKVAGTAKVDGIVRDQAPPRAPVPNALVKLFPDPPNPQHPELILSTRSDEWGNFVFENVVPGKYRAIAIQGEGPENLKSEATIAAAAGTTVELSEKDSKTLTLYLFPGAR